MLYLFLLILLNIIVVSTHTQLNSNSNSNSKFTLIKLDQKIKKLELDLDYAKVLNQNINYIDDFWKSYFLSVKNTLKSFSHMNKESIINQIINLDFDLRNKYPKNYTQVIDKYYDIIFDIVESNQNFTNNILTRLPIDNDVEFIKKVCYNEYF